MPKHVANNFNKFTEKAFNTQCIPQRQYFGINIMRVGSRRVNKNHIEKRENVVICTRSFWPILEKSLVRDKGGA
jgi:hypothetical protein